VNRVVRGAVCGAVAGVAWKALEPLLQREFRSPYSDAGIASRFVSKSPVAAYATQAVGGTLFGAAFAKLGGRGINQAVAAALAENTALWPLVWVIQHWHPDVQSGNWPKPFADPGSIQVAFSGHALYGVLLGALLDPPAIRR
jgi:hypothetical protein